MSKEIDIIVNISIGVSVRNQTNYLILFDFLLLKHMAFGGGCPRATGVSLVHKSSTYTLVFCRAVQMCLWPTSFSGVKPAVLTVFASFGVSLGQAVRRLCVFMTLLPKSFFFKIAGHFAGSLHSSVGNCAFIAAHGSRYHEKNFSTQCFKESPCTWLSCAHGHQKRSASYQ